MSRMWRISGASTTPAGGGLMPRHWNILWSAGQLGRSGEMRRVGIGIIGWGGEEGEGTEAKTGLTTISTCQVSALARIGRSPS